MTRDGRIRPATMWQPPISYLPSALREPRRPLLALGVAWAMAFLPTLAIGAVVTSFMPGTAMPKFPLASWTVFWAIVVVAPFLETLLMGTALILLRLAVSPTVAVLISAVGWGIVHSTAAPAWGLVIWWPFVIFSTVFLCWRGRSLLAAIGMASATHALHNLLPALLLVLGPGR